MRYGWIVLSSVTDIKCHFNSYWILICAWRCFWMIWFHWFICHLLCHYHIILITIALWYFDKHFISWLNFSTLPWPLETRNLNSTIKWRQFDFSLLSNGLQARHMVYLKARKQPVEFLSDNMCLFILILLITKLVNCVYKTVVSQS